jgi:hypothetical protein
MRNFLGGDFCEKYFGKKKIPSQIPLFLGNFFAKKPKFIF